MPKADTRKSGKESLSGALVREVIWTFVIGKRILFRKISRERSIYRTALDHRNHFLRWVAVVWLAFGLILFVPGTIAQDQIFPLEPADTSSPRSTLVNFLDNITEAYRVFSAADLEHESNSGLFKTDAVLAQEREAISFLTRAAGSLNFSEIPRATRNFVVSESALQLKEVLDRVPLPPLEAIPDYQTVVERGITRWRIPRTNINIVRVEEGPRTGEFLFDPATLAQVNDMYEAVRHLPYVTTQTRDFYSLLVSTPGRLLPPKWLSWVEDLPDWMLAFYYGKALWQWIALALTLLLAIMVPFQVSRWLRGFNEPDTEFIRSMRRLAVPGSALIALWFAEYFLIWQANFSGPSLIIVLQGLHIPITLLGAYVSYLLILLMTEGIITSPRIDTASLDAHMMRMIAALIGGGVGLAIVFYGANNLGMPLAPLVASLGVGGLAVALAARPTIENLIGGIILYIDRPVSVGDFCSFGEHMGTVEAIGMRSIQLRARNRTVITVPNATFADMEIINWARCDMMLILTTIGVRYETRVDQIRYLLARLREMCLAHPKIDNDTIRVRFSGYGASSQDINIRIYALTRDWNEYFAIQEDILLRVADIVGEAGTGFAFSSQTLYLGRDDGIDTETGDLVSQKVAEWRAAGELPFPNMTLSQRERLADTLDYPPAGSPDSIHSEAAQLEAAEPLSSEEVGEASDDEGEKKPDKT